MYSYKTSVRDLVAYTYFEPNISPYTDTLSKMNEGTLAHRARQSQISDSFNIEMPISSEFKYKHLLIKVSGRMDAYCDSDELPTIEEIKLGDIDSPLIIPKEDHMAQLYVYAAMMFNNNQDLSNICLKLCYVDNFGNTISVFTEEIDKKRSLKLLYRLLVPYAQNIISELTYAQLRNDSIVQCEFPYKKYRQGQREFASQVFTAIKKRKKLFASLPTGTGKSVAVIFPALKALQLGLTNRILYLTARNAAAQSPLACLELFIKNGMRLRVLNLIAKEKLCLADLNCNPESCPYADGHYIRQKDAMKDILNISIWTKEQIIDIAKKHTICPFEFALSLVTIADITIMDQNYVFDPFVMIQRLSLNPKENTILVDEAHHLVDRLRSGLSGIMDSSILKEYRSAVSKELGRKHPIYTSISGVLKFIKSLSEESGKNILIEAIPENIGIHVQSLRDNLALGFADQDLHANKEIINIFSDLFKQCSKFLYALENMGEAYKIIYNNKGTNISLELFCMDPSFRILECTKGLSGDIYFSATLQPLEKMSLILGGNEGDACFSLPSPFPKENLLVMRKAVNTYYNNRSNSIDEILNSIIDIVSIKNGKYIVYFSSYEYLNMLREKIEAVCPIPVLVQNRDMTDDDKNNFLNRYFQDKGDVLGLCVLGGSFSEGIDLPGECLIGAFIVGIGLPVPEFKTELLKEYYDMKYGNGYGFAYQYPAMQKVRQACGRVIRSETDKGLIMFFDIRYFWKNYTSLMPQEWTWIDSDYSRNVKEFFWL